MVSFKVILGVLFALLVTSIVGWGIVSYQNNKASVEASALVRDTHEVLERADEISSLFKDMQLESTVFVISGDSSLLKPYRHAKGNIVPRIRELRSMTADNARQQRSIDSLLSHVDRLITYTSVDLFSEREYNIDQLSRRINTNLQYRKNIRHIIEEIKAEENRLLALRENAHESSIAAFNRTFSFLVSGIVILLATTFFSIRYNFNKRIKAQDEQKKATELFTNLFYESPIGIVISRLDTGEIVDCNNSYSELLRYGKSELLGKTAVELGVLDTRTRREEVIGGARSHGIVRDAEVQLRPKTGSPIWTSISMQSISIDNEECLLSAVLDMTVHKEAEEKIKLALQSEIELNKLKSNFISLASHEFRTPLTTISSSAFLLENYSSGEHKEKVSKHVARIKTSVSLLTSILDEFLSLTKIEEGKMEPRKELINLRESLETITGNFRTMARAGQKISYMHSGDEVVCLDPVLVGNIVNNLVSNAIKYTHENGEIVISSTVNANVQISVKDNGIGISNNDQEHLFERFFRASNAGNVQGTGLGLHIMKHYVDMLRGSIEVQSEPGKGSEFRITFARE